MMEATAAKTSLVLATPAAMPEQAHRFFASKLAYETDPSDVYADITSGTADFVLIDVRSPADYGQSHAIGAISLPYRDMDEETMAAFSKEKLLVVYCWGPGCNGATKAAAKLSAMGFRVKEMIGGFEYWQEHDHLPVESSL